jgi:hypothetical protein
MLSDVDVERPMQAPHLHGPLLTLTNTRQRSNKEMVSLIGRSWATSTVLSTLSTQFAYLFLLLGNLYQVA